MYPPLCGGVAALPHTARWGCGSAAHACESRITPILAAREHTCLRDRANALSRCAGLFTCCTYIPLRIYTEISSQVRPLAALSRVEIYHGTAVYPPQCDGGVAPLHSAEVRIRRTHLQDRVVALSRCAGTRSHPTHV